MTNKYRIGETSSAIAEADTRMRMMTPSPTPAPPTEEGCQHAKLHFGSGDYYIWCVECRKWWVLKARDNDQPDPSQAGPAPCDDVRVPSAAAEIAEQVRVNVTLNEEIEEQQAEIAALRGALEKIVALEPEPYTFPADWQQQIDGCPECLRYKGHPIQQGICNTHRQPIWARERQDDLEQKAIGQRARTIARRALSPPVPPGSERNAEKKAENT